MNILISTVSDDIHADAAQWWLSNNSINCAKWINSDIPEYCTISINNNNKSFNIISPTNNSLIDFRQYDVIWSRRIHIQDISEEYSSDDREIAKINLKEAVNSALLVGASNAFWVNKHENAILAEYKIRQLEFAAKVGFRTPDTLVSNDPDHVRSFFYHHHKKIIFKPLNTMYWESDDKIFNVYTTPIQASDLQDDDAIRSCPAIYQEYIDKDIELRTTIMGNTLLTVAIDSQFSDATKHDWRMNNIKGETPPIKQFMLPEHIECKCLELTKRLGLVFSTIDLILSPSGDYVFVEINPMGQFLWVEDAVPEYPMLEIFCKFLISRNQNYKWDGNTTDKSLREYFKTINATKSGD